MNKSLTFPWLLFPLLAVVLLASRSADAQVAKETPLMTRALTDVPGREVPGRQEGEGAGHAGV